MCQALPWVLRTQKPVLVSKELRTARWGERVKMAAVAMLGDRRCDRRSLGLCKGVAVKEGCPEK